MVHDEDQLCAVGDLVRFEECRKISKHKNHRLLEIVRQARPAANSVVAKT